MDRPRPPSASSGEAGAGPAVGRAAHEGADQVRDGDARWAERGIDRRDVTTMSDEKIARVGKLHVDSGSSSVTTKLATVSVSRPVTGAKLAGSNPAAAHARRAPATDIPSTSARRDTAAVPGGGVTGAGVGQLTQPNRIGNVEDADIAIGSPKKMAPNGVIGEKSHAIVRWRSRRGRDQRPALHRTSCTSGSRRRLSTSLTVRVQIAVDRRDVSEHQIFIAARSSATVSDRMGRGEIGADANSLVKVGPVRRTGARSRSRRGEGSE